MYIYIYLGPHSGISSPQSGLLGDLRKLYKVIHTILCTLFSRARAVYRKFTVVLLKIVCTVAVVLLQIESSLTQVFL